MFQGISRANSAGARPLSREPLLRGPPPLLLGGCPSLSLTSCSFWRNHEWPLRKVEGGTMPIHTLLFQPRGQAGAAGGGGMGQRT